MGALIAAIAAVAAIAGSALTWLTTRRASSGRIGTSEAVTLWSASEKLRADLTARLDKVTEQRDRLIESQSAQVLPALTGINESLREITGSLARLEQQGDSGRAVAGNQAPRGQAGTGPGPG